LVVAAISRILVANLVYQVVASRPSALFRRERSTSTGRNLAAVRTTLPEYATDTITPSCWRRWRRSESSGNPVARTFGAGG